MRTERERAEGRRTTDDGLVAAEEGHGVDACAYETEGWSESVEACYCWLCVDVEIFLFKHQLLGLCWRREVFTVDWLVPAEELYAGQLSYGVKESRKHLGISRPSPGGRRLQQPVSVLRKVPQKARTQEQDSPR
jgi:hypothetical protein